MNHTEPIPTLKWPDKIQCKSTILTFNKIGPVVLALLPLGGHDTSKRHFFISLNASKQLFWLHLDLSNIMFTCVWVIGN
jgi:hypothetical protein